MRGSALSLLCLGLAGYGCASTNQLLPWPLLPVPETVRWPDSIELDPAPLPFRPSDPEVEAKAVAFLDYLRGRDLVVSRPWMDRIAAFGQSGFGALREACQDSDADLRFKATILLGELHDPRAAEILCRRLSDPSEEVAIVAARSLGNLGEPWVGPRLFETFAGLARHPSLAVRVEAARAAVRLGFIQAAPFLLLVLRENTRQAEPFGSWKDWEWRSRWAWEKWVSGETMRELTQLDTGFDSNQGVPQMEESVRPWLDWWKEQGSKRDLPASVRDDHRFQKVAATIRNVAKSGDPAMARAAEQLVTLLKL